MKLINSATWLHASDQNYAIRCTMLDYAPDNDEFETYYQCTGSGHSGYYYSELDANGGYTALCDVCDSVCEEIVYQAELTPVRIARMIATQRILEHFASGSFPSRLRIDDRYVPAFLVKLW